MDRPIDELDRQKRGEDQSLSLETDDLFNYKVIGENVQRLASVGFACRTTDVSSGSPCSFELRSVLRG